MAIFIIVVTLLGLICYLKKKANKNQKKKSNIEAIAKEVELLRKSKTHVPRRSIKDTEASKTLEISEFDHDEMNMQRSDRMPKSKAELLRAK